MHKFVGLRHGVSDLLLQSLGVALCSGVKRSYSFCTTLYCKYQLYTKGSPTTVKRTQYQWKAISQCLL